MLSETAYYSLIRNCAGVLILIVVEHALGGANDLRKELKKRLNPYCGGTCSRRKDSAKHNTFTS